MYFDKFYHQTAQGRTSDADLAANASLQPMPSGSVFTRFAQHGYDSMASTLKENGYAANAFHAYDGGFWNRNMMYRYAGLRQVLQQERVHHRRAARLVTRRQNVLQAATALMKTQPQPFYFFLIPLSSHHPYTLPAKVRTLDVGKFEGTIFGDTWKPCITWMRLSGK